MRLGTMYTMQVHLSFRLMSSKIQLIAKYLRVFRLSPMKHTHSQPYYIYIPVISFIATRYNANICNGNDDFSGNVVHIETFIPHNKENDAQGDNKVPTIIVSIHKSGSDFPPYTLCGCKLKYTTMEHTYTHILKQLYWVF